MGFMSDPGLPLPGDYVAPSNYQAPAASAEPEPAEVSDAQPDSEAAEITPFPPAAPTVSGTDITESVYQGGVSP
jgi:hypothetical protein